MTRKSQLQWAAMLVFAIVLPTLSLLWFMSRVIANERLVVGQKLAALYQDKLAEANELTESHFTNYLANLDTNLISANAYPLLRQLVLQEHAAGLVIWDAAGAIIYPQSSVISSDDAAIGTPLAEAWQLEFSTAQTAQAAARYAEIAATSPSPQVVLQARMGRSRCLARLGQLDSAITECSRAAFAQPPDNLDFQAALRWRLTADNARLLLLSLIARTQNPGNTTLLPRTLDALHTDLFNAPPQQLPLPANQNLFIARKVLDALRRQSPASADSPRADELNKLITAESLSLVAADTQPSAAGQTDVFFETTVDHQSFIGLRHKTRSQTVLVLLPKSGLESALTGYRDTFARSEVAYRITGPAGEYIGGQPDLKGKPFLTAILPASFPGWKADLYFTGSDVFEQTARRQIAVYLWTGALVILLIFIAGGLAIRAVGRQIRLNQMKNDFIATVSHELKTPLASMRVLVDTLLEGRVRNEAQAQEYLRLTVKENERLSRMIDNFLTFSRMERHKVAFNLAATRPGALVHDALESVHTKFNSNRCTLTVSVAENLPDIRADHDAMVTVLVNLLDNACKYTTENKQITLKVFLRENQVAFAVADNGIGLARRHHRKIFERFYQVDNSLARHTEGCGLGLSIVKFIVDAHRGRISVDSVPGEGSTFTVLLPVAGNDID